MFLMNLTIETELCNLRCKYCWLTNGNEITIRSKSQLITRVEGESLTKTSSIDKINDQIENILKAGQAQVLKISGGEIFMLPEVLETVKKFTDKYKKIQILTNATLLHKFSCQDMEPSKFAFQVSLDGYTPIANQLRFGKNSRFLTEKILESIKILRHLEFNVEINCVITPQNIDELPDYVEFISEEIPNVTIFPFPVRFTRPEFQLIGEQQAIDKLIQNHFKFRNTLPPKGYLIALQEMLQHGKQIKCYLPLVTLSSDDLGDIGVCPCGNLGVRGNIMENTIDYFKVNLDDEKVQNIQKWQYSKCRDCFTHFDVINLFLEGKIQEEELALCGIFQDENILNALVKQKDQIFKKCQKIGADG
jgi:sulfatase maturation enzyme AslB (radical SAM superfamily)